MLLLSNTILANVSHFKNIFFVCFKFVINYILEASFLVFTYCLIFFFFFFFFDFQSFNVWLSESEGWW